MGNLKEFITEILIFGLKSLIQKRERALELDINAQVQNLAQQNTLVARIGN
jgi:hypothetical protein